MRKLSIGAAASLLIAGIAAAPASFAASHAEKKGEGEKKMMKADANKDGMISKEEFMKAMEAKFDKMSKEGKMDSKQIDALRAELDAMKKGQAQ